MDEQKYGNLRLLIFYEIALTYKIFFSLVLSEDEVKGYIDVCEKYTT